MNPSLRYLKIQNNNLSNKASNKIEESNERHWVGQVEEMNPDVIEGSPSDSHCHHTSDPHQEECFQPKHPRYRKIGVGAGY